MATASAAMNIQNPVMYQTAANCASCGGIHNASTGAGNFSSILSSQYNQGVQYPQSGAAYTQYPQSYATFTPYTQTQAQAQAQVAPAQTQSAPLRILTQKEYPELGDIRNWKDNIKDHELEGKRVRAQVGNEKLEGRVKRVFNYNGVPYAEIDNNEKFNYKYVPVSSITEVVPKPDFQYKSSKYMLRVYDDLYLRLSSDFLTAIGQWRFSKTNWMWKYKQYDEPIPLDQLGINAGGALNQSMMSMAGAPLLGDVSAEGTGSMGAGDTGSEGAGSAGTESAGSRGTESTGVHGEGTGEIESIIGAEGGGAGEIEAIGAQGIEGTAGAEETVSESISSESESAAGEVNNDKPVEEKSAESKSEDKSEDKDSGSESKDSGSDE